MTNVLTFPISSAHAATPCPSGAAPLQPVLDHVRHVQTDAVRQLAIAAQVLERSARHLQAATATTTPELRAKVDHGLLEIALLLHKVRVDLPHLQRAVEHLRL